MKPRFFRRTVQIMVENTRMRITRVLLDDHMWPPGRGLRQHVRDIVVLDPTVAKVVWDRIDAQ